MTAGHTLGLCAVLVVSIVLLSGAGAVLLRLLKASDANAFDTFLFSTALGTILLELAVSLGELAPNLRAGIRIAIVVTALVGIAFAPLTGSDALHYRFTVQALVTKFSIQQKFR